LRQVDVLVSQGQNIADAIRLTLDKLIRKEAPDVGYAGA
jgi:hypothetical protein